jgi:uncharacterized membrane protein
VQSDERKKILKILIFLVDNCFRIWYYEYVQRTTQAHNTIQGKREKKEMEMVLFILIMLGFVAHIKFWLTVYENEY